MHPHWTSAPPQPTHPSLANSRKPPHLRPMVTRGDIIWLGISSGVTGGLIGGAMLGIGMDLMVRGQPFGFIPIIIGGPASAIIGWLLSRRLARQLDRPG